MSLRPALSISLYVKHRRVLLVGTGMGSDERASRLQDAGADLVRIAEEDWQKKVEHKKSQGVFFLVLANSADDAINRDVASWARKHGCLTYAHDQPEVSDFSFPALATRGYLKIAISTHGEAPALAAQFRRQLTVMIDSSGTKLDALMDELKLVRKKFPSGVKRIEKLKSIAARVRHVGTMLIEDK